MGFEFVGEKARRESGISKVVTESAEDEAEIKAYYKNIFENQETEGFEKEKSEDDLRIIKAVNDKLKDLVERYGGEFIDVKPQNIHILDKEKLTPEQLARIKKVKKEETAVYSVNHQAIVFMFADYDDRLKFAQILAHELLHFNSFQSITKNQKGRGLTRRVGIGMGSRQDKNKEYFGMLNEALTEELAIRFDREYLSHFPELAKEIEERKKHTERIQEKGINTENISSFIIKEHPQEKPERRFSATESRFTYTKERKKMNETINHIYKENKEKFNTREDVFEIFAKAFFTGRILKLAHLIENAYEKGAFRKLGEDMAKIHKLEQEK
ncbi:MAG: hypothetical protein WCX17_03625 [Parcubacteria group bacterium]|jgi:predicted metallopeptidase